MRLLAAAFLLGNVFFLVALLVCVNVEAGIFSPRKEKKEGGDGTYGEEEEEEEEDFQDDIFKSLGKRASVFDDEPHPFNDEERAEFEDMMRMIDSIDWGEGSVDEISALMDGLGLDFTEEEIESLASVVKDEELAHSSDMLGEFREVIEELQKDGETLTEIEVMEVIEALGGTFK